MKNSKTLLVVVLYRAAETVAPEEDTRTLRSLAEVFGTHPLLVDGYDLLVWDNSASTIELKLPIPFRYHHAVRNDGVSGAYNGALSLCLQDGYEWVLLLDDDTEVSAVFLAGMLVAGSEHREDSRIAAIAPLLYDKDFLLSPQQVLRHRQIPVPPSPSRVLEDESFAANSGLMLRASALAEVGGYSLDFWLDYSDIDVFHRLYAAGKRIYLAAELRLQHSMTMLDYDGRMTAARYVNFLYSEQAFFDLYRTALQNAVQVLRLLARVVRQRRYHTKVFSRLTRQFLFYRLRTAKAKRLGNWAARKALRHAGGA